MAKYIIELERIEGTNLYRAKGANTLVFDEIGIKNTLTPYEEEKEVDWSKVAVDTPILVRDSVEDKWTRAHFSKYDNGRVCTWNNGCTSWFFNGDIYYSRDWKYAKLAKESKKNDN